MQYFGARSRAYDTDVIQLFKALADFTQPIELQKTLKAMASKFALVMALPVQDKYQSAFHGVYTFKGHHLMLQAWSSLDKRESLACQITSPFNKKIGCFGKAIFLILFSKANPVTPL